jgi:hypothetical protein
LQPLQALTLQCTRHKKINPKKSSDMKRILIMLSAFAGISLFYIGCSKEPLKNLTPEESRIYITDHDSSVSFSDYKTFSISDSIAVIDNGEASHELSNSGAAYIDAI